MRVLTIFLVVGLKTAFAAPTEKIVGGEVTSIEQYPFQAVVLISWDALTYNHECGGSILNSRSILTAAHCLPWLTELPNRYRVRVGSTFAHSGGVVHNIGQNIPHPFYNPRNLDNDVGIMRTASIIVHNERVRPALIAGPSYFLPDDEPVWAIGWGRTSYNGDVSEQLRHVQVWTINQAICRTRYAEIGDEVTNNMLCAGWLDVGGRDQCNGDSGSPLLHNNVVVGVSSWGEECALPRYPGVNARVSRFTNWIQVNA